MIRDELLTALTTIRVSGGGGITASDVAREMIDYAGFALVPIEPTEAMLEAGSWVRHGPSGSRYLVDIYKAMLKAAEEG